MRKLLTSGHLKVALLVVCVSHGHVCIVLNLFQGTIDSPSNNDIKQDLEVLGAPQIQATNDDDLAPIPGDLADEVEGMYRLMDLISESGSNGYGEDPFRFFNSSCFQTLIWRQLVK